MRHIKKPDILARVTEAWLAAANAALADLQTQTPARRSAFIAKFFKTNKTLWRDLKRCLAQPTPPKCWYSEAKRSIDELEIDHFRPKNEVSGTTHAGYWWLAFDWQNFRIASIISNKRRTDQRAGKALGKSTFFPLLDESQRATAPGSLNGESPLLLDPFVATDVKLLDYSGADGKVVEKFTQAQDPVKYRRAHDSIDLYHLNEGSLIARRVELSAMLKEKGDKVEELFSKQDQGQALTPTEERELETLQNEIAGYINATSEFSAFCRACIQQRGNRGWNDELLRGS